MKIALVQTNSFLGHFEYNQSKIIESIIQHASKGAELIIFPEAALFGYHPYDLLERSQLVDQQLKALKGILSKIPKNVYVLIGGFSKNISKKGKPFYNSAFLCTHKKIIKTFNKELLPTGDVFDEARFIEKGQTKNNFFKIKGKTFLATICEDIWAWDAGRIRSGHDHNPLLVLKKNKVDFVLNMSSSPYYLNKDKHRLNVASKTAQLFKAPLIYVNMVGGQDEVIYDGSSFVVDKTGKPIYQLQSFVEDSLIIDTDNLATKRIKSSIDDFKEVRQALVLGIKDFCFKTGLKKVHLGLSGGIDSAVVAALAAEALGSDNVKLFALPTQYNLSESFSAAKQLADNLKIDLKLISINDTFQFIKNIIDKEFSINEFSVVHENLQARIRGLLLMAYSNFTGSMLLTTGNKSEYATGYATLYGDMCGGLAVIGDLTKQQVYGIAKTYNVEKEIIPSFIIDRPPSAELRPNQKDQDSLPEYDILDQSVENIVEKMQPAKNDVEKWLVQQLMKTEFKRWQAPPVLKVSSHAFGRGRRYPIAYKTKE